MPIKSNSLPCNRCLKEIQDFETLCSYYPEIVCVTAEGLNFTVKTVDMVAWLQEKCDRLLLKLSPTQLLLFRHDIVIDSLRAKFGAMYPNILVFYFQTQYLCPDCYKQVTETEYPLR